MKNYMYKDATREKDKFIMAEDWPSDRRGSYVNISFTFVGEHPQTVRIWCSSYGSMLRTDNGNYFYENQSRPREDALLISMCRNELLYGSQEQPVTYWPKCYSPVLPDLEESFLQGLQVYKSIVALDKHCRAVLEPEDRPRVGELKNFSKGGEFKSEADSALQELKWAVFPSKPTKYLQELIERNHYVEYTALRLQDLHNLRAHYDEQLAPVYQKYPDFLVGKHVLNKYWV